MIITELKGLEHLRFVDPATGKVYQFEIVSHTQLPKSQVAPHSGFGVPIGAHHPVDVVVLRKVEVAPARTAAGTAEGRHSGRTFSPEAAGGEVRRLDYDKIKVSDQGVAAVERHLARFGGGDAEAAMLARLKRIAKGEIAATPEDKAFYAHELRESVRYRKAGWATGQPADDAAAYDLWNNLHSATLEDYRLRERDAFQRSPLFHADAEAAPITGPSGARGGDAPAPRLLADGQALTARGRRSLELDLQAAGHGQDKLRGLDDNQLLAAHGALQVELAPRRVAAFRDGLDVQARTELDAITGAPHLQSKPVAGAMEGRLAKALGTPVEVDPTIPHGEVRVVPEVGPLGIVTGVKIVVGRGASVAAVIAHIPSLYQKQRLVGLAGSARRIVAAVKRLLAGGGTLPVTSRGHEAWEEVQKLPPIIDAKLKQLAGANLDPVERWRLELEIASLERQLARHVNDLGDLGLGRGYVAADLTTRPQWVEKVKGVVDGARDKFPVGSPEHNRLREPAAAASIASPRSVTKGRRSTSAVSVTTMWRSCRRSCSRRRATRAYRSPTTRRRVPNRSRARRSRISTSAACRKRRRPPSAPRPGWPMTSTSRSTTAMAPGRRRSTCR